MAEKTVRKITRKVIRRSVNPGRREVTRLNQDVKAPVAAQPAGDQKADGKRTKTCYFCDSKTLPSYTDANALRRFLQDRSRITPKMRSGVCSKHQRRLTTQIKYARHLALLPFIPGL